MSEARFVLCEGSADLSAMTRMLARAVAEHLQDWAVVIDPDPLAGSATLYRPGMAPVVIPPPMVMITLSSTKINVDAMLAVAIKQPRAVQYLVMRTASDAALTAFLDNGNDPKAFHVCTPIVDYGTGPYTLPPNADQWLIPKVGRYMPAIRLREETAGHAGPLTVYPIGTGWNAPSPPERDSCRLRINSVALGVVDQALSQAADQAIAWTTMDEGIRKTFERWARTITWRRVGIVLSGGGASVFRLVQFFHALEAKQVPIDLIGGVSGGTVFAAAYAFGGMPKVHELVAKGVGATAAVVASLTSSWFVERFFDKAFEHCGVRNTEIRVLALSTGFPPKERPYAAAIIDGTLGQAVRASGGAPFFGPYFPNDGDTRQVDGGITATVPPPFLAERFGADIVFAANVIAVPSTRFPGEKKPILGPLLTPFYRYTPLGRVADMWNAVATMLHTIAEGNGLDADDFLDTEPRDGSLLEPVMFYDLTNIVDDGLGGENIQHRAGHWMDLWRALP